jgi:epoxide hydrolase-like predicted phosphatase
VTANGYRGLIVDFGGVLTTPLQEAMAAFASDAGIEMQDLMEAALGAYTGRGDTLVTDFERGRISEPEFELAFAKRLTKLSGAEVLPRGLVERIFGAVSLEEEMFDLVGSARIAGFKTGLCSNSWGMSLYPRDRLLGSFDAVVISSDVGLRKPDPAIFELIAERLELSPTECVFVDDHAAHLDVARRAGMTTVLHKSPSQSISEIQALLEL